MMRCPTCNCQVAFEKGLFGGRRCKECGATMLVSLAYLRVLMVLSFIAAEILLWIANIPVLFYPTLGVFFGFWALVWLGFPLAFLMLTVLVRTVPRFVAPTLVLRHWGSVTTLDIAAEDNRGTIAASAKR